MKKLISGVALFFFTVVCYGMQNDGVAPRGLEGMEEKQVVFILGDQCATLETVAERCECLLRQEGKKDVEVYKNSSEKISALGAMPIHELARFLAERPCVMVRNELSNTCYVDLDVLVEVVSNGRSVVCVVVGCPMEVVRVYKHRLAREGISCGVVAVLDEKKYDRARWEVNNVERLIDVVFCGKQHIGDFELKKRRHYREPRGGAWMSGSMWSRL